MKYLTFLLLAATTILGGCGKRMDVLMRHPLQVGQVDQPNTITARNGWQANMVSLDPDGVCFDVSYVLENAHQPLDGYLQNQSMLMNAEGQWFEDAEVLESAEPQISSYQGTVIEQQQQGMVNECVERDQNNNCNRWEQRPRYVNVRVPATFFRTEGGGRVCFPNQGRITLASDRVAFQINRTNFRWGLEDQTVSTEEE